MSRFAVNKAAGPDLDAVTTTPPTPSPTGRRIVVISLVVVVVAAVGAFLADTIAAISGEHRLARSVQTSPHLTYEPEVTISGFPYLRHAVDASFGGATVTARGVAVGGCERYGGCRAELGATLGPFTVPDGWSIAPSDALHTESTTAYTRLDSVNLGRMLGIIDLTVNTPAPEDKAGGGSPADGLLRRTDGVLMTGTVALPPSAATDPSDPPSASAYRGPTARVSVRVDLSVRDGRLHLQATDFYDGPEEHAESDVPDRWVHEVLARFTTTLPQLPLPWGLVGERAYSEGSDILISTDDGPRTLRPDQF